MDFLENAAKSWNQSSHFLLFKKTKTKKNKFSKYLIFPKWLSVLQSTR